MYYFSTLYIFQVLPSPFVYAVFVIKHVIFVVCIADAPLHFLNISHALSPQNNDSKLIADRSEMKSGESGLAWTVATLNPPGTKDNIDFLFRLTIELLNYRRRVARVAKSDWQFLTPPTVLLSDRGSGLNGGWTRAGHAGRTHARAAHTRAAHTRAGHTWGIWPGQWPTRSVQWTEDGDT